jgi:hypothetical protein
LKGGLKQLFDGRNGISIWYISRGITDMWIWKSDLESAKRMIEKELKRSTNTEGSNLYLKGKLNAVERLLQRRSII